MAKSKKKAKDALPKRIAGVKVPKAVRRGRFAELLSSRKGQALIAEALLGAGAIAAGVKAKDDPKLRGLARDAKETVARAGTDLLPKRIGGVKVPKRVRRGRFAELLASRKGRTLITEALLGAGAIAAGMKAKDRPKVRRLAGEAKDSVTHASDDTAHEVGAAGATLAYALGEAARAFAEALRSGGPAEPRSFTGDAESEAWTPDYGAPEAAEAVESVPARGARKRQSPARDATPL